MRDSISVTKKIINFVEIMEKAMRKIIKLILVISLLIVNFHRADAQGGENHLFIYPTAPDSMTNLQPRCDYLVSHFWDRCNFNTAFRNPAGMNIAFRDWVYMIEHASADTVHTAVDKLIARFNKKGPETLALAQLAETWLYGDSGIISEEVYLPFARAVVNNKKIKAVDKARYASHVQIIESSALGANVPALSFIRPDGSTGNLGEITGTSVLIFINDPECEDCNTARVRLAADYNANQLINRGELTIVSVYPGEPDSEWLAATTSYPQTWTICAIPDADEYFSMRTTPAFFFLNSRHKVLAKDLTIDYLLGAFRVANIHASQQ